MGCCCGGRWGRCWGGEAGAGPGRWIVDPGPTAFGLTLDLWTRDPGPWTLDPGPWTRGLTLGPAACPLDPRPDPGPAACGLTLDQPAQCSSLGTTPDRGEGVEPRARPAEAKAPACRMTKESWPKAPSAMTPRRQGMSVAPGLPKSPQARGAARRRHAVLPEGMSSAPATPSRLRQVLQASTCLEGLLRPRAPCAGAKAREPCSTGRLAPSPGHPPKLLFALPPSDAEAPVRRVAVGPGEHRPPPAAPRGPRAFGLTLDPRPPA